MHTILGQDMTPAVVKGLCPRNGGHGVGVLLSLEQGQTLKMKGQDQQGTLPGGEPGISSPKQVELWSGGDPGAPEPGCGVVKTPELRNGVVV